jgi:hypothetical protein
MLRAHHYIRSLSASSNLHLIGADDGEVYVVKLACGSRPKRLLATELLGLRLARDFGLPVPDADEIRIPHSILEHAPALCAACPDGTKHLAIAHIGRSQYGQVIDLFPTAWDRVHLAPASRSAANVFAAWTESTELPRAIYWRAPSRCYWPHLFIGFSACFAGGPGASRLFFQALIVSRRVTRLPRNCSGGRLPWPSSA